MKHVREQNDTQMSMKCKSKISNDINYFYFIFIGNVKFLTVLTLCFTVQNVRKMARTNDNLFGIINSLIGWGMSPNIIFSKQMLLNLLSVNFKELSEGRSSQH